MAISTKPKAKQEPSEAEIKRFINAGGSTSTETQDQLEEDPNGITPVILRVPNKILGDIDEALKNRPVKKPRHQWLLEAAYEKLEREKSI